MTAETTETALVRTRKSMTVHRRTCPHGSQAAPWRWAESRTRAEIEEVCTRVGLKLCQHCDPLAVFPRPDDDAPRHQRS